MKETFICIVTPENRTYYQAVPVAKEFLDKDQNIIHSIGTIPDGAVEEIKTSSKTIKHYKNGKLDGELSMLDLNTGQITFTEQYKDGELIDVADHTLRGMPLTVKEGTITAVQTYQGTTLKTNQDTLSFYVDGKEIAEQTVSADGTILEQMNQVPDGPVKEFDENRTLRFEAVYKNNRIEGEAVRYSEQGKIISQENYQQGKLNGLVRYYNYCKQGTNVTEANYKNGLLDGPWTVYMPGGKPLIQAYYQEGKLQGPYTTLYKNGQVNVQENYGNGKLQGTRKIYFPNGNLWYQEHYKNGRLEGERLCFFPNGQKFLEEFYTDGLLEGTRRIYTENGSLLTNEEYHWGSLLANTERRPLK